MVPFLAHCQLSVHRRSVPFVPVCFSCVQLGEGAKKREPQIRHPSVCPSVYHSSTSLESYISFASMSTNRERKEGKKTTQRKQMPLSVPVRYKCSDRRVGQGLIVCRSFSVRFELCLSFTIKPGRDGKLEAGYGIMHYATRYIFFLVNDSCRSSTSTSTTTKEKSSCISPGKLNNS